MSSESTPCKRSDARPPPEHLGNDGKTTNDAGDPDSGALAPNEFQNTPVISSASYTGGTTDISFSLNTTSSRSFAVDFFANTGGSALGKGACRG